MVHKHSKILLLLLISCLILNLQVMCKTLKVGVLTKKNFKYFIDARHDSQKNVTLVTGFSVDVFTTCINALPNAVRYDIVPFENGSYDDLIKKVHAKEIDAIMGDSTILSNRSQYADFTATYTEMGIGTLIKVNDNDRWIFLKPLHWELWASIGGLALFTGVIIWAIEAINPSPRPPAADQHPQSIAWVILMSFFFAQRESFSKKWSKLVLFVWLFAVFILTTSYTATLTSLLTIEQFELASKIGTLGFHGGSFEAGVAGVTISNLHFEDYRRKPIYSYEEYGEALSKGGKHGGADAIIDEIPYIKMFLAKHSTGYSMISTEPSTSGFGFIFAKGSPLVRDMSRQIAKIREDGTLRILEKKWFEKQSLSSQDSPIKPKVLTLGRFQGLFIISASISAFALLMSGIAFVMPQSLVDASRNNVKRITDFVKNTILVVTDFVKKTILVVTDFVKKTIDICSDTAGRVRAKLATSPIRQASRRNQLPTTPTSPTSQAG